MAAQDPVAAYSFDAGEGTVAEDAYGEHDGAIEGASWFENGKYGKALSFDGENDCVTAVRPRQTPASMVCISGRGGSAI